MIKVGTIAKYAPEWRREEEKNQFLLVYEAYDDVQRCKIEDITPSDRVFHSTHTVTYEMLKPTGICIGDLLDIKDLTHDKVRRKDLRATVKEVVRSKEASRIINDSVGLSRVKAKDRDDLYICFYTEGYGADRYEIKSRKLDDILAEIDKHTVDHIASVLTYTFDMFSE